MALQLFANSPRQFISWIDFWVSRVNKIFLKPFRWHHADAKAVAKQHCLSDDVMLSQKPLLSNTAFTMTSCWRDNFQVEEFPSLFLWVKNFKVCVCFVLFFSWNLLLFPTQSQDETRQQLREYEETKKQIEEDADREILDIKNKYERRLREEKEANLRLKGETGIMRKKVNWINL